VIATWYIGWNVYDMHHADPAAHINYVAHVSGAITGVLLGVFYRLFAAQRLEALALGASA
jgi:membrane associated rhomboid family serine protease